jgi:hypothetical protein
MAASPSEPDLKYLFLDVEVSYKFFVTHLFLCTVITEYIAVAVTMKTYAKVIWFRS